MSWYTLADKEVINRLTLCSEHTKGDMAARVELQAGADVDILRPNTSCMLRVIPLPTLGSCCICGTATCKYRRSKSVWRWGQRIANHMAAGQYASQPCAQGRSCTCDMC